MSHPACLCGAHDFHKDGFEFRCTCDEIVFKGYTRWELTAAFRAVANRKDWKAPIHTFVPANEADRVKAAINFFTATVPSVSMPGQFGMCEVKSIGYRRGPAGP